MLCFSRGNICVTTRQRRVMCPNQQLLVFFSLVKKNNFLTLNFLFEVYLIFIFVVCEKNGRNKREQSSFRIELSYGFFH